MKYRKKPVVIEAFKWTGDIEQTEDPVWIIKAIKNEIVSFSNIGTEKCECRIKTLEGTMIANRGDYIIQGVNGEIYPCKPDIFQKTYEPVMDIPAHETIVGKAITDNEVMGKIAEAFLRKSYL